MPSLARRAPVWLDVLRSTPEWRLAHTPLDSAGNEARPVYPWAFPGPASDEGFSFQAFLRSLDRQFGGRVAIADYSHVRFSAQGEPDRAPTLHTYRELI